MDPGDHGRITRDIIIGDGLAFRAGESVIVERVSPDAARPANKYVVLSQALGQRFLLADNDLAAEPVSLTPDPLIPLLQSPAAPVFGVGGPGGPGDVFATQHGSPGDLFSGQRAPIGPPPGRGSAPPSKKSGFRSSRAFLPTILVAIIVVLLVGVGAIYFATRSNSAGTVGGAVPSTWKQVQAQGITLWMPPAYDGGNLKENLDKILTKLRQAGPEYSDMVQVIEKNPDALLIIAVDSNIASSSGGSSINVVQQALPPQAKHMNVRAFMDAETSMLPSNVKVVGKKTVLLNGQPAGELMVSATMGGISFKEVQYVVMMGTKAYSITYTAPAANFDKLLPDFKTSAGSVRFQ